MVSSKGLGKVPAGAVTACFSDRFVEASPLPDIVVREEFH